MVEIGKLPLIITAPHGGWEKPTNIPDRERNGSLIRQDLYTKEIAEKLYKKLTQHYGQSPHMIVNLISRRKADPNRPIEEGTETEEGEKIWLDYHDSIKRSIMSLHKQHNFGLLIDIHGQTHKHGMVELGYLLRPEELKLNSNQLVLNKSSIQSLARRCRDHTEPHQLLNVLGNELCEFQVPAVPSNRKTIDEDHYFFGAYTTETYHFHDKKNNKGLDTIQIEIPQKFRLTSKGRSEFVQAIENAVIYFIDNYYMKKPKL